MSRDVCPYCGEDRTILGRLLSCCDPAAFNPDDPDDDPVRGD